MNDELQALKTEYQLTLNNKDRHASLKLADANRYIAELEAEVQMLEDLFETNVAELEEMNKTQAADISRMIKEKNEKPLTNLQMTGRLIGRLRRPR